MEQQEPGPPVKGKCLVYARMMVHPFGFMTVI